jgi:hypothetical protein
MDDEDGQEAENDYILDNILAGKGFHVDQAKGQKKRAYIWFGIKEDK